MKTFINKLSGTKWIAMDNAVVEGDDAWHLKHVNVSLPKSEWEEKKDGQDSRR